jgi:uncharacterized membrane-anchored protein
MSLKSILTGAAVGLQVLVAVAIPVRAAIIAERGTPVLLHVEPRDPYDPLRGYSLALAYDIDSLDALAANRPAGTIYVTLAPTKHPQSAWEAIAVTGTRPKAVPTGDVVLKGRFTPANGRDIPARTTFGIESFYLDEADRTAAADRLRSHQALAEVRVASDGTAVLVGIL